MDSPDRPRPSSVFVTIDLDKPGKQTGFVMIPHSPHDDAWGATRIPIAVIANGTGPTVILEGGKTRAVDEQDVIRDAQEQAEDFWRRFEAIMGGQVMSATG